MLAKMSYLSRCLLLITSFTIFLFLISRNDAKNGEDGAVLGFHAVANLRLLLAYNTLRPRRHHSHELSPAPAPAPAPAHAPLLHKNAQPRPRSHSIAPAQSTRHGSSDQRSKKRVHGVAIATAAAAAAGAALVVLGAVVVLLVCKKKLQRSHRRSDQAGSNKASFDLGPDLLYLDTLKPYLEACDDRIVAEMTESKAELVHGLARMKGEEDAASCSDGDDDDGSELSFHSICCFHSSHFPYSELPEAKLSICSPSIASCNSMSPICRSEQQPSAPPTPSDKKKISCSSPQSLEIDTLPMPRTPNNQDRVYLASPNSAAQMQKNEFPRMSHSFKFLKVQTSPYPASNHSERSNNAPETEGEAATVCSNLGGSKALTQASPMMPPPPPPPPPSVLKQRNVQKSCGSSIPPPPPAPPSVLKPHNVQTSCGSSLPPPPPPCLLKQNAPVGKDGAPLPKLKPLHWDKVRAAPDRRMVWDRIKSNSFEFDEEMIESLFGYNSKVSSKHEEAKSKSPASAKHVMDHKRLQNITILMKALNATTEQLYTALLQGNGLSVQQLEALVKMTPTKEEVDKFLSYEGDIESLIPAEKLIRVILTIPCAFSRAEAMLYREAFADEVDHLNKSFAMLRDACRELRSSKMFLKLLEAVLKTGNRMNVGTIRGGARAFRLDALLKLADVKGADGKTTLLHFVVQEMTRSHKAPPPSAEGIDIVSGLSTELTNVKKTASVDLDVLISSVSNLSCGLSQIKELVEKDLCHDERTDVSFVTFMRPFISHAEKAIRELKDDEDEVLAHVRDITEYYHGDVSKDEANPLRIFVIVRDFLGMLDRVCKEVRSS